jgi:hypothetical protein
MKFLTMKLSRPLFWATAVGLLPALYALDYGIGFTWAQIYRMQNHGMAPGSASIEGLVSTLTAFNYLIFFALTIWMLSCRARDAGRNVVGWTIGSFFIPIMWIVLGCLRPALSRDNRPPAVAELPAA